MIVAAITVILGQYGYERSVDPRTFVSPSGRARLFVDPDRPEGTGSAKYRLTLNGKVQWAKTLPFTLVGGGVADDGRVGGYAYVGEETFMVAILRPDGKPVLQERHVRKPSRFLHTSSNPMAWEAFLSPDSGRLTVRIADPDVNRGREEWWTYRLSDGMRGKTIVPKGAMGEEVRFVLDARPVTGTGLTLVHWWRFDGNEVGATFTLIDAEGTARWRMDVPDDYEVQGNETQEDALRAEMRSKGAILSVSRGRFDIRLARRRQRVSYAVEGGRVRELRRVAFMLPSVKTLPTRVVPTVTLRPRGTTTLPVRKSQSPIHDVGELFVTGNNRVVFLRAGDRPAVVEVDGKGTAVRSVALPLGAYKESEQRHLARLGADRFLMVGSIRGKNLSANAWTVDLRRGRAERLAAFRSNSVDSVAGWPDGRFVVLSTEDAKYSSSHELAVYDAGGRRQWLNSTGGGWGGKPEEMLSPEDVTVDRKGRIVVLDNIAALLQRFDASGKHVGNIDLKKAWKRKPEYPTDVTAGVGDELLVHDFGAEGALVRVRPNGGEVRRLSPRLANGKKIEVRETPSVDADGKVWVTDGHGLYRLGGNGVADRVLSGLPSGKALREIGDLVVIPAGGIYAADAGDQRVHAFDAAGRTRFVASPRTGDFDVRPMGLRLQVTRSGDVYVEGGKKGILHFSPQGRRLPDQPWVSRDQKGAVPARAAPDWRWKWNVLLNGQGRPVTSVRRWPNGDWLQDDPSAFAPDGRFVIVEYERRAKGPRLRFAVYAATGRPLRMASLPPDVRGIDDVAFDGERLFVVRGREVLAVSLGGVPLWKSQLPSENGQLFVARGGLAWFDGEASVRWYGLPRVGTALYREACSGTTEVTATRFAFVTGGVFPGVTALFPSPVRRSVRTWW